MARGDSSTSDEAQGGEPVASDAGLLDSKPVRFVLTIGLPVALCLLAGSAIYVTRLGVDGDVQVLAQREWVPGGTAAVRVVAYGPTGSLVSEVGVALTLRREGEEAVELAAVRGAPGLPAVDADVTVPSWPPGPATLEVTASTPWGEERTAAAVLLAEAPAGAGLVAPPPPSDRPRGDPTRHDIGGDLGVELLPYGGALVPNLTNVLFLRTTSAGGGPASAEVDLELIGGTTGEALPGSVRTDRLGLAALTVHPTSNDLVVEVRRGGVAPVPRPSSVGSVPGADAAPAAGAADAGLAGPDAGPDCGSPRDEGARIQVGTAPAQLVLRLSDPVVPAGEPLTARVESLHASRPLFVDAFSRGVWIASQTTLLRGGRGEVRLASLPAGVVLVQATTTPMAVGRGYSAHHVLVTEEGGPPPLRLLAERLRDEGVDRPYADALLRDPALLRPGQDLNEERATAFLLSRLDRGFHEPVRLVSSAEVRSADLEGFQRSYRLMITIAIAVLGFLVTVLLAYSFSVAAYRARQRRLAWEASTGGKEEDVFVTSMGVPKGLDRFRIVVQIALMVGGVAVAFVLLAMLVSVMYWRG